MSQRHSGSIRAVGDNLAHLRHCRPIMSRGMSWPRFRATRKLRREDLFPGSFRSRLRGIGMPCVGKQFQRFVKRELLDLLHERDYIALFPTAETV